MAEVWKDIVGYEGSYQVSNFGKVYSLKTNKILKGCNCKNGYERLVLRKDGKSFSCTVHRLVANAFIDNPEQHPIINHKDENPQNNRVDNLEWCSFEYNCTYGTALERRRKATDYKAIALKNSLKVAQYDLDGNFLSIRDSANEYKREFGFDNSSIAKCCRGVMNTAYGYKWKYVNDEYLGVNYG